jgi:hypothetical protein
MFERKSSWIIKKYFEEIEVLNNYNVCHRSIFRFEFLICYIDFSLKKTKLAF